MRITTENIEEWCFRYLEKDLTSNEIIFFEKELLVNSDLCLELRKWKKTFLTNEDILPGANNIEHALYRFKHQVAILLAESVLVIGICAGLFVYANKQTKTLTIIDTPSTIIESSKPNYKTSANKHESAFIINKSTIQIKAEKAPNISGTPNIEPLVAPVKLVDSISQSDIFVSPTILEKSDPSETIKDSSQFVKKPKAATKKSNVKRNYSNGSRLIPINNDL
jgi:hypothetical protein